MSVRQSGQGTRRCGPIVWCLLCSIVCGLVAGCDVHGPPPPPSPKDLPEAVDGPMPEPEGPGVDDVLTAASDQAEIYASFLRGWNGNGKQRINVSREAKAPTWKTARDFSDCAFGPRQRGSRWLPTRSISDLTGAIGDLPFVRLVDARQWKPQDPGALIARGKPVKSAVEAGFGAGLMTLSAIVFDPTRRTAAFSYSFVCGGLCGSGGDVIYEKTEKGWKESAKHCGGWVS